MSILSSRSLRRARVALALGLSALLIVLAACSGSSGKGRGVATGQNSWGNEPGGSLLWSAARLNAVMADGQDIVIVDCRLRQEDYDNGHIPGAVWVNWKELSTGNHSTLPATADVEEFFGRQRGISRTDTIVLYGAGTPGDAFRNPFRLFWMLEYYGCRDVHVVDGGIRQWSRKGYPLDATSWSDVVVEPADFSAEIDARVLAAISDMEWAVANRDASALSIVDVRTPAEYNGEAATPILDRAGRIPGAANIYWYDCIDSATGLIQKPDMVKKIFRKAGVAPGGQVYAVANAGVRSTVLYFMSRLLGNPAKVYLAGFHEWSDVDVADPLFVERAGAFAHKSADGGNGSPVFSGASAELGGRIFVFGGLRYNANFGTLNVTGEARLFDPAAEPLHEGSDGDCWQDLSLPRDIVRYAHAAAADPADSAIYLFGGIDANWQPLDTILRCDVDPATFAVTAVTELDVRLPEPLHGGAAVRDPASGLVYLFGGGTSRQGPLSASVFAFTPHSAGGPNVARMASLPTPRIWCAGAAVEGKAYCIGGEDEGGNLIGETLEYDPAVDAWSAVGTLNEPRLGVQAAVVRGRIYLCGGFVRDGELGYVTTGSVESLDPDAAGEGWRLEEPMGIARYWHFVGTAGGRIYLIGGYKGHPYNIDNGLQLFNVVEYAPVSETARAALPGTAQYGGGTAAIGGCVYIFGGGTGGAYSDTVLEYDPASDAWTPMDPLPHGPVMGAGAISAGDIALVMGGLGASGASREVWSFDPAAAAGDQWSRRADMPEERYGASIVLYDDEQLNVFSAGGDELVLILGGNDSAHRGWSTVSIYDTANDSWILANVMPLPQAKCWASAAVIGNRIYSMGGIADSGAVLDECLYLDLADPAMDWKAAGPMPTARFGHASAVAGDTVYNIGGLVLDHKGERASTAAVESLDCGNVRWTRLPGMAQPLGFSFAARSPASPSAVSLIVIGGYTLDPEGVPQRVLRRDVIEYAY
jgi:thiosulfate/3-mercaptopyruvate sulfurtransferase